MCKPGAVNFPRINLISLLAGALALASVFLPWWGIDASGFGSSVFSRWTLWNGPSTHRNCFWNYSELGFPNRLLSLPFCWSSDAGRAGLPSNLPQDNFNTCAAPSFRGHELSPSPNCGPTVVGPRYVLIGN